MVLALVNDEIQRVLTMADTLAVLEELYQDLGTGSAVYRPRSDLHTPTRTRLDANTPTAHYLKTMDGAFPRYEVAAIRLSSDVVAWPLVNGQRRREKLPAAPGERFMGLVLLFSTATGELLAILQDSVLQRFRVGATNGIGAKYLAREDARTVGLLGSGWQAGTQLMALCQVRPIEHVKVYSPTPAHRQAFAEEWSEKLGVPIQAVDRPEAAAEGVDIAVTATNSRAPFFPAEWLGPGMHLSCMQRDEATDECFRRADVVVFHTRAKEQNYTSTDFAALEARLGFEVRDHQYPRAIDWNDYPDLAELVSGRAPARANPEQITLFLNSIGVGAQFAAVGQLIYHKARARGLGTELPVDLFLENTHP